MATPSVRFRISLAAASDRPAIHRARHRVYAAELGQHAENEREWLEDSLDASNEYILATLNGEVVGFISITPPNPHGYSVDKYLRREEIPVPCDSGLYELRLLTVDPAHRGSSVAALLMYAGYRWISSQGASHVVALGRTAATVDLYEKVGLRRSGRRVQAGAVEFELMSAPVAGIRPYVIASGARTARLRRVCEWDLGIEFEEPAPCYHGGASFSAIGDSFDDLGRAAGVIAADVLDAWFPPAPEVVEAVREHLPFLLQVSPPTDCGGLLRAIAHARGIHYDTLVPGAGSSDLIFRAFNAWLTPQSRVLMLDPTYGEYVHVAGQVIGCQVDRIPLSRTRGYAVDLQELRCRTQEGYDLVVLVNPNSPTGRHVPKHALCEILDAVPPATRMWIDETYIEYVGPENSLEEYAARSRNTVVCKSMSKVYALSGARVAYLCGPPMIAHELRMITPPWAVSLPAQLAATRALAAPEYYRLR